MTDHWSFLLSKHLLQQLHCRCRVEDRQLVWFCLSYFVKLRCGLFFTGFIHAPPLSERSCSESNLTRVLFGFPSVVAVLMMSSSVFCCFLSRWWLSRRRQEGATCGRSLAASLLPFPSPSPSSIDSPTWREWRERRCRWDVTTHPPISEREILTLPVFTNVPEVSRHHL